MVLTSTTLCFGEAVLTSTHNLCFEQKYETYQNFYLNFQFLVVEFSVYLNRRVFVMMLPYGLILTPLLALFLICLYISSRVLSKEFEHRDFVARYQRETNHITVAKIAPLVTMEASLQYCRNIHIHNKLY